MAGPYHAHRLAVVKALLADLPLDGRTCVDVGCGEGTFAAHLAALGARVIAFDLNEEMARAASARLAGMNASGSAVAGGVELLARLPAASVDVLFALNVLAYFTDEEERTFYGQAARLVRPGGALVVTHSNELFDLYSLNAFTLRFFARHLCPDTEPARLAALLTSDPALDRPVFNVRENPLTYRFKLARHGFLETRQEFAHLHEVPPPLVPGGGRADIDARSYPRTLDWPEEERWKLMFICSMFASRSTRQ
jgi:2-polyprenyl-3-methyl-5-hydroxy-6-metoxy-1,4-benzoquinol methylase